MGVNEVYRKAGDPIVASYDFYDFAEGTGVKIFNGMKTNISGALAFILSDKDIYSAYIYTGFAGGSTFSFDLNPFNAQKVIKGTAYLSVPLCNGFFTAQIQKVVQNVSGSVINCSSAIESEVPGATGIMQLMSIPLTQTTFSVGDVLRLKIVATSPTSNGEINHDPLNRDGNVIKPSTMANMSSKFRLYMPFRIED